MPEAFKKIRSDETLNILHICSDFAKQKLYAHLVTHLAEININQVIYAAVRSEKEARYSPPALTRDIPHFIRHILGKQHRILFRTKIKKAYNDLRNFVDLSSVDVVHSHFLFSDGAVALKIKKQYGIPFIVAVRNTDINGFMRLRPDLFMVRNKILKEASRIVFISPAYQKTFAALIGSGICDEVYRKSIVVPNGIEKSWLSESHVSSLPHDNTLRILYVGDFSNNKNVYRLIHATLHLSAKRAVKLTLVGGGGNGEKAVKKLLASGKYEFIEYLGKIDDREKLQSIYRQHDLFVMVSFVETFGVVYIEALSQGLPIIYSRGQGVDGYFESHTVSEAANPYDFADIGQKIEILANRLDKVRQECIMQAKRFEWCKVAENYKNIYIETIHGATKRN